MNIENRIKSNQINKFRLCRGVFQFLAVAALLAVASVPLVAQTLCHDGCVTTYGYDDSRDNVNPGEIVFKASSTNWTSGISTTTSANLLGEIYAQPLFVSRINMAGTTVDALYVATEENQVYALDGATLVARWGPISLNPSGNAAVPDAELPGTCPNIMPEVGVTGTPVIDLGGNFPNVMYVVSKDWDGTNKSSIAQQLNALKISDGTTKAMAIDVSEEYTDLGLTFSARDQNQRAGLAIAHDSSGNPLIYVAWGSHCDMGSWSGKVAVFTMTSVGGTPTLSILAAFDDEPSSVTGANDGGIWMGGAAPAVDDSPCTGNCDVYLATGNGYFYQGSTSAYGQSLLRLAYTAGSPDTLAPSGFYTPNEWQVLNLGSGGTVCSGGLGGDPLAIPAGYGASASVCGLPDMDLSSGGVMLLRPTSAVTLHTNDHFVLLGGGKEGVGYVIDPYAMTGFTAEDSTDPCSTSGAGAQAIQCFGMTKLPDNFSMDDVGRRGTTAFWSGNHSRNIDDNALYVAGSEDPEVRAYQMQSGTNYGAFNVYPSSYGTATAPVSDGTGFKYPGACPVISWDSTNGAETDAVLWILSTNITQSHAGLFAYQAMPSGGALTLKYSNTADGPSPTKFSVPTVVDGHVYVAGQCPTSVTGCSTTCLSAGSCLGEVVSFHP